MCPLRDCVATVRSARDFFVGLQLGQQATTKLHMGQALNRSISLVLNERLNQSLSFFSNQPIFWVDRVLSKTNNLSRSASENYRNSIKTTDILNNKDSLFIKSPPQFGLTSLAHYLVKEAWELEKYWAYVNAKTARASKCRDRHFPIDNPRRAYYDGPLSNIERIQS